MPPAACYWLPKPFCWPQSGHCQVMPLQESPQKFSGMHPWQMAKPQRQVQQKGTCWAQQWHTGLRLRRVRRGGRGLFAEEGMGDSDAAVHDHVDAGPAQDFGGFPVFDAGLHPEGPGG